MGKLLRFVFALVLVPLFLACAYEAVTSLYHSRGFILRCWVTYGFLAYLPLRLLLFRRNIEFLETLEHETLHAVAAIFSGRRVTELVAGTGAGKTQISPGCLSGFVFLAPYCLPLILLPLLVLSAFTSPPVKHGVNFVTGLVLGFHIVALVRSELDFRQTDLKKAGYLFSYGMIGAANATLIVVILSIASGEYWIIPEYLEATYQRAMRFYTTLYEMGALIK